jgi:hypothetical protein
MYPSPIPGALYVMKRKKLLESEYNGKLILADKSIESNLAMIFDLKKTIETLNEKLSEAYREVKDIATSTVDSAQNKEMMNQMQKMVENFGGGNKK